MKRAFILSMVSVFFNAWAVTIQWEQTSPYPTVADLKSVAHGNGVFVAAGKGVILFSEDGGLSWKQGKGINPIPITDVEFGNGLFVATSASERLFTSTDGKVWASNATGLSRLNTITFGKGLFVAGGDGGVIATSASGFSWKVIDGIAHGSLHLATFGNDTFILKETAIVGPSSAAEMYVVTSPDGKNWTRAAMSGIPSQVCTWDCTDNLQVTGLAYANGAFYARVNWGGMLMNEFQYFTSLDGTNWADTGGVTPVTTTAFNWYDFPPPSDLRFVNGEFIQLAAYPNTRSAPLSIFSSPDLKNWKSHILPVDAGPLASYAIGFDGSSYVVTGTAGAVFQGPSLDTLTRLDNPEKSIDLVSIATHGDVVVGVGNMHHNADNSLLFPRIIVSNNGGRAFRAAAFPSVSSYYSTVRYANGKFLAVGAQGAILRSTDGVAWDASSSATSADLFDLMFADGKWIAVGNTGTVVSSTDGLTFTGENTDTDLDLRGVAFGNGIYVAVGENGALLTSNNRETWSLSRTPEETLLWGVAYGNGMFVATGDNGRVYTSTDAAHWTSGRILGADSLARVAFARGLFVAISFGGGKSYVSWDATTWTQVNVPSVSLQSVDASEGLFWLSGVASGGFSGGSDFGTYVFRETPTQILLHANIGSNNKLTLTIDAPAGANYRIYSAQDSPEGTWESQDIVYNSTGQFTWDDPTAMGNARFYRVRQE